MIEVCPFCQSRGSPNRRCQRCGWGPRQWPYQAPFWEERFPGRRPLSWLASFWDLATTPRFFFQRLSPQGALWGALLFAMPIFLVLMVFMACHLPAMLKTLPDSERLILLGGFEKLGLVDWAVQSFPARLMALLSKMLLLSSLWVFGLIGLATCLLLGIRLSLRVDTSWRLITRLLGYALTPGVACAAAYFMIVCILAADYCGYVPEPDSMLLQFSAAVGSLALFLAMYLWPYSLLLTGLEEMLQVNRYQAQIAVLAAMALAFASFALVGAFL